MAINFFNFIFLYFFYLIFEIVAQCPTSYTDISIHGNNLSSVQARSSSCCQHCQQTQGCRAFTWDNFQNGTCWLKSSTQPIFAKNGSFSGIMIPDRTETYNLNKTYAGSNFFDDWVFEASYGDGIQFVDRPTAENLGMIGYQNGKVYIGVEHNRTYNNSNRPTTRIQSKYLYNSGLFVLSFDHMPTGLGTWPAFWTYGPHWPSNGEIDILEGVYVFTQDVISFHTGENCTQNLNDSIYYTGNWYDDKRKPILDCYQYANNSATVQQGCSNYAANGTFNTLFNQAGGGVYAMQWDREKYVRIWNFVKPNIPADILNGSPNPNPDSWGLPTVHFSLGDNCTPDHLNNHTIVFDTMLCGSWVDVYYPGGQKACVETVRMEPQEYAEAYWLINYVKVFCRPNEPCGFYHENSIPPKK